MPALARRFDQHRMVADIAALLEIELEQALRQPVLHVRAGGSRPADDAVRVERVGRDLDGVEVEVDAVGLAERLDAGVDLAMRSSLPNLAEHVALAVHAFGRDGRVELERPPAHLDIDVARLRRSPVEPLLADEAPRADDVRDDVDRERLRVSAMARPSFAIRAACHQVGS